jgi:hypothetical protein
MRILRSAAVWTVAGGLMLALGSAAWGQTTAASSGLGSMAGALQGSGSGGGGRGSSSGQATAPPSIEPPDVSIPPQAEEEQSKLRNVERQKQLVADAQKLLSLANELKEDVDKSTKDTLSLDVIRKADEIEKLAHTVKEKMKGT